MPAPAAGQHQDAPTASDDSGSNNAQESFLGLCPAADFWKTDREIMQRTVWLGRPVVTAIAFRARRSVLSADGKKKTRFGFLLKVSALAQYPIARLRVPGTPQPRIVFAAPPGPQNPVAQTRYLVDLCQVGPRRFQSHLGAWQKKRTDRAQLI